MARGSTQPLTEMSTRNLPRGGPRCYKKTQWPESATELNQASDRRLSAKLVPTFVDREVSRGQHGGSIKAVITVIYTEAFTFS
jgi:hypothetical protein